MTPQNKSPADVLLLIATGCAHCSQVLSALSTLVKEGEIGRLEIVNINHHQEVAAEVGTRSVPWIRIGSFELSGARGLDELRKWATRAREEEPNQSGYLAELIETQRLDVAMEKVRQDKNLLHDLMDLMSDPETGLSIRIGIGAIFEDLLTDDPKALTQIIPSLSALTGAPEPQIRADACYYLGLTRTPSSADYIRSLLDDVDPDVREIAADSLALIEGTNSD